MATYYSTVSDTATTAQAYGRDLPCSPKSGRNVARAIKGMPVARAKVFLEGVIKVETPVPFKVRVRKIHHRKGGIGSGRYPVQTAKCMLKVLESAEANAEYKGLDKDRLVITHSTAYQGQVILTQPGEEPPAEAEGKKGSKKASKIQKAGQKAKAAHEAHAKREHKGDKSEKGEKKADKPKGEKAAAKKEE